MSDIDGGGFTRPPDTARATEMVAPRKAATPKKAAPVKKAAVKKVAAKKAPAKKVATATKKAAPVKKAAATTTASATKAAAKKALAPKAATRKAPAKTGAVKKAAAARKAPARSLVTAADDIFAAPPAPDNALSAAIGMVLDPPTAVDGAAASPPPPPPVAIADGKKSRGERKQEAREAKKRKASATSSQTVVSQTTSQAPHLHAPVERKSRLRLILLIAFVVVAVAVAVAVTVTLASDDDGTDYADLNVGDCVRDLAAGSTGSGSTRSVTVVEVVDCNEAHDAEVYAVGAYPGDKATPFPGDEAISTFVADFCQGRAFESYVGKPRNLSGLVDDNIQPSTVSWKAGRRQVICMAADPSGTDLTGSVKASAR